MSNFELFAEKLEKNIFDNISKSQGHTNNLHQSFVTLQLK